MEHPTEVSRRKPAGRRPHARPTGVAACLTSALEAVEAAKAKRPSFVGTEIDQNLGSLGWGQDQPKHRHFTGGNDSASDLLQPDVMPNRVEVRSRAIRLATATMCSSAMFLALSGTQPRRRTEKPSTSSHTAPSTLTRSDSARSRTPYSPAPPATSRTGGGATRRRLWFGDSKAMFLRFFGKTVRIPLSGVFGMR